MTPSDQFPHLSRSFPESKWRGTFRDYFQLVQENPDIAMSAHQRVYRMILSHGDQGQNGRVYPFFSNQVFGIEDTVKTLVDEYFRPAAMGFEVRKRILLLVGPVSGGKSTLVSLIKRGLEEYTKTDSGALYGIEGCPMHEEPLHLLPTQYRSRLFERLGIMLEGDLCPWCRWQVDHVYQGNLEKVPVERIHLSERYRVGIGTYAPSDPKSQDIADLTGSVDFQAIAQFGSESDPRAYRFDGELNIANRGLMEFQEMLKLDEKFLYHLLSLSQEGNFKTGRYELISADEVIIGHTNEHEYRSFLQNPRNEALASRLFILPVPYNLDRTDEVRIYQKLLLPFGRSEMHIAPLAFEVAAAVAVLSRIQEMPKPGGDRMNKLEVYSGDNESETRRDLLQEGRAMGEGMGGLDPRYVINRMASLMARSNTECVDPVEVLQHIKDGIEHNPFADKGLKAAISEWVHLAREWYNRQVERQVLEAFAEDWDTELQNLYQNYVDNVVLAVSAKTGHNSDHRLLRSIEERMGVSEVQAPAFREEIYLRLEMARERQTPLTFLDHPGLYKALREKLFDDLKDEVKVTTQSPIPDRRVLERIEQAAMQLVSRHGYCERCASKAIHHVGGLLNR